MTRGLRSGIVATWIGAVLVGAGVWTLARAADETPAAVSSGREIPAEFATFEYLIGSWKGVGIPTANRIRGWPETHAWAWKFEKGNPVGMSVEMTGDKTLTKAQLVYDRAKKSYTLGGSDAAGKPVSFTGTLDKTGKTLTLDRVGATSDGAKQRLTLTPNANFIRYTLRVAEQEVGSPQFKPIIEVPLGKEGESFAAGSSVADLPKCIVTGGAATMTVSYQGKSFPLCCSGCKDEFNDNPEKYIKKLAMRSAAGAGKAAAKPASSAGKDDGTFGDVVVDTPKTKMATPAASADPAPKAASTASASAAKSTTDASAKAAASLRIAQNLEKSGKTAAALTSYREVVKLYPGTPSAKTASDRIKALGVR